VLGGPPLEYWLPEPIDVVHSLALGYPVRTRKPLVVTVHDIGPLTHPEWFPGMARQVMRSGLRHMVDVAAAIICVSKSTAEELRSHVDANLNNRLHVIYEGVPPVFFGQSTKVASCEMPNSLKDGTPYILTVGAGSPRKNLWRVLEAFERIREVVPHHLVMVGGSGWANTEVNRRVSGSGSADRIHHVGYVTDGQLHHLYREASALVYASLYEGFGLPVLEAMASGCPVVASNLSSLTEVAGDAAVMVDPRKVSEIADGITAVCTDDRLSTDLRDRGRHQSSRFTWESCIHQMVRVYRGLL
jgi:glycosyltransferase involved in cell wall biosynthesis